MQRYEAEIKVDDEFASVWVYRASEVDNRIEQLEKALQSCRAVLERQQETALTFQTAALQAIVEADKALAL